MTCIEPPELVELRLDDALSVSLALLAQAD
jgi:hypothetical protein